MKRTMHREDYRSPGDGSGDTQKRLLDQSTGRPAREAMVGPEASLAKVAAAIHANAPRLSSADCEQAVRWLKQWKLSRSSVSRPEEEVYELFSGVLDRVRKSEEQVGLMNAAVRRTYAGEAWLLAAFLFALGGVAVLALRVAWYAGLGLLAAAVWAHLRRSRCVMEAAKIWKEQEGRFFLKAVREAETATELTYAGIFEHLPETELVNGSLGNEDAVNVAKLKEAERLSDALYRIPFEWLYSAHRRATKDQGRTET